MLRWISWTAALLLILVTPRVQAQSFDHTYALYASILNRVVIDSGSSSTVKYFELIKAPEDLDSFIRIIEAVDKKQYHAWSEAEKISFLVNSYNALTLKLIASGLKDNPELKSIKELGGLFSSPWKKKFFQFLGEKSHLDRVEHEIARKSFDEPRMHFAFNCASIGCPKLSARPFVAARLDKDFDEATKAFLSDKSRNRFNESNDRLEISAIFKWYSADFNSSKKISSIYEILEKYMHLPEEIKPRLRKIKVHYLEYDWALNSVNN
jgi:hypothetical protein